MAWRLSDLSNASFFQRNFQRETYLNGEHVSGIDPRDIYITMTISFYALYPPYDMRPQILQILQIRLGLDTAPA